MSGNRNSLTGGGGSSDDSGGGNFRNDALREALREMQREESQQQQDDTSDASQPATGDSAQDTGLTRGGSSPDPAPTPAPEPSPSPPQTGDTSGQTGLTSGGTDSGGGGTSPSGGTSDTTTPTRGGASSGGTGPVTQPEESTTGQAGSGQPGGGLTGETTAGIEGQPQSDQQSAALADDVVGSVTGPPGAVESAAGDVAFGLRDVSAGARDAINQEVVDPAAEVFGDIAGATTQARRETTGSETFTDTFDGEQVDIGEDAPINQVESGTEGFLGGLGRGATGATVGAPAEAVNLGALGADAAEFTATQVEQEGVTDGAGTAAQAGLEFGQTVAEQQVEQAQDNPAQFAGTLFGGLAGGLGTARAVEGVTGRARLEVEGRTGPDVDAADTTRQPETLRTGQQPEFETGTGAPGEVAAREMRQRAREQPGALQDATGSDQVLLRSESDRLPGDLQAQEGSFELPGLFASGDFPPLRTETGSGTSLTPRLPRPFTEPERASAFEAPDIEAAPDEAAGSGFALRETDSGEVVETGVDQGEAARRAANNPDLERAPDPTTAGFDFLQNQAERGTAFTRPAGDRTQEFEAVFPPETEFERVSTGTVDLPGTRGTLDVFRRADDQPDAPDADGARTGQTFTASEVSQRTRGGGTPEGQPVSPFGIGGGGSSPSSSSGSSGTTAPGGTVPTSEPASPTSGTAPTDVFGPGATGTTPQETSPPGTTSPSGTSGGSGGPSTGPTDGPFGPTPTPSGGPSSPGGGPTSGGPGSGGGPTGGGGGGGGDPPGGGLFGGGGGGGSPFGAGGSASEPASRPRRPRVDSDPDNDDDERRAQFDPFGSEFQNPVQGATEALLGIVQAGERFEQQSAEVNPQGQRAEDGQDLGPFGRF
jgi:hypothetical protein